MNARINQIEQNTKRIDELDFLKSIFILLMISFHLTYIGDGYPLSKQFVYTFHMPGFLIISGYLMKVNRPLQTFGKTILWLAVPYFIMETGYVVMASFLPIRDHIDNLSAGVMLQKLFVNPLGPYWYLHTLIICGTLYFAAFKLPKLSIISRIILLGLSYYGISLLGIIVLPCALYFLAGVAIRQSLHTPLDIFRKSGWSALILLLLVLHPETFDKATIGGILIVYFVFSFCLTIYHYIPQAAKRILLFLGRNSLVLYIFFPIFTICCKKFIPYLAFDSTRLLFLCISLPVCIIGCLATRKLLDILHLSPLIFGSRRVEQTIEISTPSTSGC